MDVFKILTLFDVFGTFWDMFGRFGPGHTVYGTHLYGTIIDRDAKLMASGIVGFYVSVNIIRYGCDEMKALRGERILQDNKTHAQN